MSVRQSLAIFMILGAVLLFAFGCQASNGSQREPEDENSRDLIVYVTTNAQSVREKAMSYGLKVKTIDSNSSSAQLIQALLNSPSPEFFAVINPALKRYIAGGAISDNIDPALIDSTFSRLAQVDRAGVAQLARLQPSAPGKARITVFSDYQCPYCKMMDAILPQWKQQFGNKLEIEFINFPLDMHKNAFSAAEAAECARDQGKFDEYKEALFDQQKWLGEYLYSTTARRLHLDSKAFYKCWSLHEKRKLVRQDQYFGQYLGVNGTPSLYLNGKSLSNTAPDDIPGKIKDALSGAKPQDKDKAPD